MHSFNKDGELLPEEREALQQLTKVSEEELQTDAISVVTNLYRTAQGLRNKMEQEVLSGYRLSWTSFSILYDLWISGPLETKELARLAAVSKATISNITNTLERKEFCSRKRDTEDKRISYVSITDSGRKVMEELYPKFHQGEAEIVRSLEPQEQQQMSALLRRVIRDNQF